MQSVQEVYGSVAPPKSDLNDENLPLTDEQVKERMQLICGRFPTERDRLRRAYDALKKVEHRTHLAISFLEPSILQNEQARTYLQKAIDDKKKLTESDKEALTRLENESLHIEYDLAKFDCETTEKDYAKLEKLLSYAQSEMKLGS